MDETRHAQPEGTVSESSLRLERDHWGKLSLVDADGRRHEGVRVVPLFPLTEPDRWIAVLSADGEELAVIDDPGTSLNIQSRDTLLEELSKRVFSPQILRVFSVSGNSEPCEWHVQTDRGETRFVLASEENVQLVSERQVVVTDTEGIRYRIPDYTKLDSVSRRIVEWYV